jgi:hypothetical protein
VCRSGQAEAELWPVPHKGEGSTPVKPVLGPCESLAWMPGGRLLAVRSRESITFFETGTWRPSGNVEIGAPVGARPVMAVASGGRFLATPAETGEIKLLRWGEGSGGCKLAATLRPAQVQSLSALRFCGKDDRFLVAGTVDGQIQIWDLVRLRHELAPHELDYDETPLPPVELECPIRTVEFVPEAPTDRTPASQ